jgi:hypothetical protein
MKHTAHGSKGHKGELSIRPGLSPEQRLGVIVRRHGGRPKVAAGNKRVPDPPRPTKDDLEGEPQLI